MEKSSIYKLICDERNRLAREIDKIDAEIEKLPQGSMKIYKQRYIYLVQRDKDLKRSKTSYYGTIDAIEELEDMIGLRKSYEVIRRDLKDRLTEMDSYLKAGDRFYRNMSKKER